MKGLELKLIFKNSKAYLTNDNSITIQEQSLNNYVKNFNSVAYWTIRVKGYFEDEKRIFCEVLLYQNGKSDFDYTQKQISDKLNLLQKISFNKISTQGLLSTIGKSNRNSRQYNTFKPVDKPIRIPEFEPIEKKPVIQNINETFYVPIKDVNFKLGSVSFERKFRGYNKIIQLEIPNYDIKEEYDAIKNYFANILKTKKIQVTVNINIVDHEITKQNVYSQEINRINKQLIDEVKFNILKSATKSKMDSEKENNLFTVEEYFKELINDEFDTTTFFNNDEEFLNDIIKITDAKHYKQLGVLSNKHSHDIMKLKFNDKPFAFIFLITGVSNYHFVWETLNTTEATYIWHFSKDLNALKDYLTRVENIIKTIKTDGKLEYISNTKENFNRVFHDYSNSSSGFKKWKEELERLLI